MPGTRRGRNASSRSKPEVAVLGSDLEAFSGACSVVEVKNTENSVFVSFVYNKVLLLTFQRFRWRIRFFSKKWPHLVRVTWSQKKKLNEASKTMWSRSGRE